jgi:simple sugar transport system ATP-binding protein
VAEPLIRMEHISKSYGRVQALEDVTFTVNAREIVGLLGDNGAGKSTLIKVLSGAVPLTSGDIFVRGRKVDIRSTTDAIRQGIETIYQDSALVTQLSIARNLFLGREPVKRPRFLNRMDQAAMNQVARDLLRKVGISKDIPPTTPISSLSEDYAHFPRVGHLTLDSSLVRQPLDHESSRARSCASRLC